MTDAVPFDAAPVLPVRLADGVVASLSAAILEGRLRPGDPLPAESRLAESYGVSKQVVREALRQLAALGALRVGQGRATRVAPEPDAAALARFWRFAAAGTRQGLAEAVELRRILEPQVARLAAQRADAAGLDAMRAVLDRMEAAMGDVPRWIAADLDFHEQLARLSGNGLILLQVQGLRPVVEELMRRFNARLSRTSAAWRHTLARHRAVLDTLAARDPAAAEAAMLEHFGAMDAAMAELFPMPANKTEETA